MSGNKVDLMKTCFAFLLLLAPHLVDAFRMNTMYHDTLTITGTCAHIGQTQNIIATAYFRFTVLEVKQGSYAGDIITIEGDVNNRGYKLYEKVKTESTDIEADKLFPHTSVRRILQCASPPITIHVLQVTDEFSGAITFQYVDK